MSSLLLDSICNPIISSNVIFFASALSASSSPSLPFLLRNIPPIITPPLPPVMTTETFLRILLLSLLASDGFPTCSWKSWFIGGESSMEDANAGFVVDGPPNSNGMRLPVSNLIRDLLFRVMALSWQTSSSCPFLVACMIRPIFDREYFSVRLLKCVNDDSGLRMAPMLSCWMLCELNAKRWQNGVTNASAPTLCFQWKWCVCCRIQ